MSGRGARPALRHGHLLRVPRHDRRQPTPRVPRAVAREMAPGRGPTPDREARRRRRIEELAVRRGGRGRRGRRASRRPSTPRRPARARSLARRESGAGRPDLAPSAGRASARGRPRLARAPRRASGATVLARRRAVVDAAGSGGLGSSSRRERSALSVARSARSSSPRARASSSSRSPAGRCRASWASGGAQALLKAGARFRGARRRRRGLGPAAPRRSRRSLSAGGAESWASPSRRPSAGSRAFGAGALALAPGRSLEGLGYAAPLAGALPRRARGCARRSGGTGSRPSS